MEPARSPMSHLTIRLVTPSYQHGRFIEQTIRSVLGQDYPGLTYFVADGGSTDGTVDVLRRLLPPYQWRSRPDGGQTAAIAEAFQAGDEEILGWVNSDDFLLPGAIRRVAEEFVANPKVAIVHGEGVFVDEHGTATAPFASLPIQPALLEECNVFVQPSTFVRRSWYERVGGLDPRLSKTFDYDLFLRIVRAGGPCRYVRQAWSAFRIHPHGQTTALWHEFVPEELAVQWRQGNRMQFARRYAQKLCMLCMRRTDMTFHEAQQFVDDRLDRLLASADWREDAPPKAVARYFRAEWQLRGMLCGHSWLGRVMAALRTIHPANLVAVGYWLRQLVRTGQWRLKWRLWRLSARARRPAPRRLSCEAGFGFSVAQASVEKRLSGA